jgi:hypothetical protein
VACFQRKGRATILCARRIVCQITRDDDDPASANTQLLKSQACRLARGRNSTYPVGGAVKRMVVERNPAPGGIEIDCISAVDWMVSVRGSFVTFR